MRVVVLRICFLIVTAVFVAMFFAIFSARRSATPTASSPQSLIAELVWAAVPCLMILAAATPAVMGRLLP